MEKKTIGKFIAALRKANGMTQKELGEKLFVSDKTVSRWERDECTPELSLIPAIAEIFDITTDELLRGERISPQREMATGEETAAKQNIKSEKQFKLMLHSQKKKFTNLSFLSIGLLVLGLILATVCNLGFLEGMLGFCLACMCLVGAAICQICFTVTFRVLPDEDEQEHACQIKKSNTEMVFASVKIFFAILLVFAWCLPLATHTVSHSGLTFGTWCAYGTAFATLAFLLAFSLYKIWILKMLMKREAVFLDPPAVEKVHADGKLLGKIWMVCICVFLAILLATDIAYAYVTPSTFTKQETFDSPDAFIMYMQKGFDDWYQEGFGDLPQDAAPDPDIFKKWNTIDGKAYYYRENLYESIVVVNDKGGPWKIAVVTEEAHQTGQTAYRLFELSFLCLHAVNVLGCLSWYLLGTRKHYPPKNKAVT